jgi:hypothetical protein
MIAAARNERVVRKVLCRPEIMAGGGGVGPVSERQHLSSAVVSAAYGKGGEPIRNGDRCEGRKHTHQGAGSGADRAGSARPKKANGKFNPTFLLAAIFCTFTGGTTPMGSAHNNSYQTAAATNKPSKQIERIHRLEIVSANLDRQISALSKERDSLREVYNVIAKNTTPTGNLNP